jgi:EAL domain-containing protein (putative c-di-GMP-specific phosphodiesterase class I)
VVADRLRSWEGDSIAISHLAGDEFAMGVAGRDAPSVLALAEAMRSAVAQPIEDSGFHLVLSATVSVSHAGVHGTTSTELLRRAQAAKERGKALGGDCVSVFLTEQMQDIEDRMTLGGGLRSAAGAGEFRLHYQPQVDAGTGALNGFEALLRWDSPTLGAVPPARFIPVAESLGLMPEIGAWVIREACRQARRWLDAGHVGFVIAINVSAHQVQRPGLVQVVTQALADFRIPPRLLEIELTETALLENVARVQGTLAELKALGVTLSLDDFGTGYSSLAYLKNFSLDKLKIDQGFVRGLPGNADDAAIAQAIVSIGHQHRLSVVAEGVECPEQAELLRQIGCDELQGYLYGRPSLAAMAAGAFPADDRPT